MKTPGITMLLVLPLAFSAFSAEQITLEQAEKHIKIGELSFKEDGFTMSDDGISKKVEAIGGEYYVITSTEGKSDYKNINVDVYK